MSNTQFFVRGRNKGNERRILLSSATLLVGKAPAKAKRVKLNVRMPLGERPAGTPEWVMNAMTIVAQDHGRYDSDVQLGGFELVFSDDNLFAEAKAKASKCDLRKFVVLESGDSESPNVEMQFVIYAPFSRALWAWAGQYGGEECWAQFTQVEQPEEPLELTGDDQGEDDEGYEGEPVEG